MAAPTQAMDDWIKRVLGVAPGATRGTADWAGIADRWQAASDEADRQIAALQAALRATDDEVLESIAETGLNALTGNFKVPMMAALRDVRSGNPAALAKSGPKLLGIVSAFKVHLETSEDVEVCDDNPFDVPVSIRATLGGALAEIETTLQRAA